jgi:hypothetical protein
MDTWYKISTVGYELRSGDGTGECAINEANSSGSREIMADSTFATNAPRWRPLSWPHWYCAFR